MLSWLVGERVLEVVLQLIRVGYLNYKILYNRFNADAEVHGRSEVARRGLAVRW